MASGSLQQQTEDKLKKLASDEQKFKERRELINKQEERRKRKSSSRSSSGSSSSSSKESTSQPQTPEQTIEAKKAASPTGTIKFSSLTEAEKAYIRRNDSNYKTFAYEDGLTQRELLQREARQNRKKELQKKYDLKPGYADTLRQYEEGSLKSNKDLVIYKGEVMSQKAAQTLQASEEQEYYSQLQDLGRLGITTSYRSDNKKAKEAYLKGAEQRIRANVSRKTGFGPFQETPSNQPKGTPILWKSQDPVTGVLIPTVAYSKKVSAEKQYSTMINPARNRMAAKADKLYSWEAGARERWENAENFAKGIPGLGGESYFQRLGRDILAIPQRFTAGTGERIALSAYKAAYNIEGVAKKETRADYLQMSKEAYIQLPDAVVQAYNPKNPEGLINIGMTFLSIKGIADAKLKAPVKPKIKGSNPTAASQKYSIDDYYVFGKGKVSAKDVNKYNSHTFIDRNVPTGQTSVIVNRGKGYVQVSVGKNTFVQAYKNSIFSNKVSVYKQTMTQPGRAVLTTKTSYFDARSGNLFKSFKPTTQNIKVPKFDLIDRKILLKTKKTEYIYKGNEGLEVAQSRYIIRDTYKAKVGFLKLKEIKAVQDYAVGQTRVATLKATHLQTTKGQFFKLSNRQGDVLNFNNVLSTKGQKAILQPGKITAPKDFNSFDYRLSLSPDGKILTRMNAYKKISAPRLTKDTINQFTFQGRRYISSNSKLPDVINQMLKSKRAQFASSIYSSRQNLAFVNVGSGLKVSPLISSGPGVAYFSAASVRGGMVVPILPAILNFNEQKSNVAIKYEEIIKNQIISKQKPSFKRSPEVKVSPIVEISPVVKQVLKSRTLQKTKSKPIQEQQPITAGNQNIFNSAPVNPLQAFAPSLRILMPTLKPYMNRRRTQSDAGFNVFVKSKGKWLQVNTDALSKMNALSLGARSVDASTAASFKIKSSKSTAKKSPLDIYYLLQQRKYRRSKASKNQLARVLVEKSKYRIDAGGEIAGISIKGLIAQRQGKKSKKNQLMKRIFGGT